MVARPGPPQEAPGGTLDSERRAAGDQSKIWAGAVGGLPAGRRAGRPGPSIPKPERRPDRPGQRRDPKAGRQSARFVLELDPVVAGGQRGRPDHVVGGQHLVFGLAAARQRPGMPIAAIRVGDQQERRRRQIGLDREAIGGTGGHAHAAGSLHGPGPRNRLALEQNRPARIEARRREGGEQRVAAGQDLVVRHELDAGPGARPGLRRPADRRPGGHEEDSAGAGARVERRGRELKSTCWVAWSGSPPCV